jgi:hypothetical protein
VSQAIEFSKTVAITNPDASGLGGVCIDNTMYSYVLGRQVTDDASLVGSNHRGFHGLIEAAGSDCSNLPPSVPASSNPLPAGARELLSQHMRLGAFTVTSTGSIYTVRVKVIYGDDDLLKPTVGAGTNWANEDCSGSAGQQFCAVSDLTTTVGQRLL